MARSISSLSEPNDCKVFQFMYSGTKRRDGEWSIFQPKNPAADMNFTYREYYIAALAAPHRIADTIKNRHYQFETTLISHPLNYSNDISCFRRTKLSLKNANIESI